MNSGFKDALINVLSGDDDYLMHFIEKLQPMIRSAAKIAGYDCAETDLIIFLIEKLRDIDETMFDLYSEGQLVKYFKTLLNHKAIDLYRKNIKNEKKEFVADEIILSYPDNSFSDIFFYDLISNLTIRQKQVVIGKIILNMSDVELASLLHISRQAVNRLYNRALTELRKEVNK